MSVLNVPPKSPGDSFLSTECNAIVDAIKLLQTNTGYGIYIDDEFTEVAPQVISSGLFTNVLNNAGVKEEGNLPLVGGLPFPLYDGTKLVAPAEFTKISAYFKFRARIAATNSSFQIGFDAGGIQTLIQTETSPRGNNVWHDYLVAFPTRISDVFFANGANLQFQCDDTMQVWGATYFLSVDYVPIGV